MRYVDAHWVDMRPKSLQQTMAEADLRPPLTARGREQASNIDSSFFGHCSDMHMNIVHSKDMSLDWHDADLPLGAAQLGVWYAIKSGTPVTAFNIAQYIKIFGAIEPAVFENALRHVVRETGALRVQFVEHDYVPRQSILPLPQWCMTYKDFSSETDPISVAEAWMRTDLAKSPDLSRGPLFAFALFKIEPQQFWWYARYSHLVVDGIGHLLIARRVAEVYSALAAGSAVDFQPSPSLVSLIEEDFTYRASQHFKSDRQYWLNLMSGCPEPPTLGLGTSAVFNQVLHKTADLSSAVVEQLQRLARRLELTLPQVLTLSSAVFIHRLTEAEDLVLGQFMTGRLTPLSRQVPAMVRNLVPLRFNFQPDMRVEDLAVRVRRQMRSAMRHQRYPSQISDVIFAALKGHSFGSLSTLDRFRIIRGLRNPAQRFARFLPVRSKT